MSKPRNLYWNSKTESIEWSKPSAPMNTNKPDHSKDFIHFREVVPIDWSKVWEQFEDYCGSDKCTHKWPDSQNEIQQLVEAQLRGEE